MSSVRSFDCKRWICSTTRPMAALAERKPGNSGSSDVSVAGPTVSAERSRAAHGLSTLRFGGPAACGPA